MVPRKTSTLVSVSITLLFAFSAQASSPDYYTVHDQNPQVSSDHSIDPLEAFTEAVEAARRAVNLNLMNWDHHQQTLEDPSVPYNRKDHYGTWVRDPADGTCHNTRARVLIRDSASQVSYSSNGCTVRGGEWHDPYSNHDFSDASDLQIDHVVPLKNSYISGAWKWDGAKRCLYANYMQNDYHLLAVNGSENMRKGDRTPEGFMPSDTSFACDYLTIWLKIKMIWNLALTPSEADAITHLVQQNHCDSSLLVMNQQELRKQRQAIVDNMGLCSAKK